MNFVLLDDDERGAGNRARFTDPQCLSCGQSFKHRGKAKKYCSRSCQKKATRHSARGSTSANISVDRRDVKRRQRATLAWLNETYYGTPPGQRLGLLKDWLDKARSGDTLLRAVLSRPDFRTGKRDKTKCYRNSRAYPPVPYLTDRFALRFLNCWARDWVSGKAVEPETGEVGPRGIQVQTNRPHPRVEPITNEPRQDYIQQGPADFLQRIRAMRLNASE